MEEDESLPRRQNNQGKKWAGELDKLAGLGKRAFALAAPVLEDVGHTAAVDAGRKAIHSYDNVRSGVVEADARIGGHARRIASADLF